MVEFNVISLSRGVSWIFAWIVKPIIAKFPGEALVKTLEVTRKVAIGSAPQTDSMIAVN